MPRPATTWRSSLFGAWTEPPGGWRGAGTIARMEIHPIDLPAPMVLWARWAVQAAALTAVSRDGGERDGGRGRHHGRPRGNRGRLALVDGGGAVLFGYDHEYSATVDLDPPLDLLAGAPDWLPWE